MTIRKLIQQLLGQNGDLDRNIKIKVVKRSGGDMVSHYKITDVSYLIEGHICIEQSEIENAKELVN